MKKPLLLLLLRLLLAAVVILALPFSHARWGEPYPGDGQRAFGFIVIFTVFGSVAAVVFVGLGSLGQFLLRRQPMIYTVLADLVLFLIFVGVLIYGGITAKYTDTATQHSALQRTEGRRCVSSVPPRLIWLVYCR